MTKINLSLARPGQTIKHGAREYRVVLPVIVEGDRVRVRVERVIDDVCLTLHDNKLALVELVRG